MTNRRSSEVRKGRNFIRRGDEVRAKRVGAKQFTDGWVFLAYVEPDNGAPSYVEVRNPLNGALHCLPLDAIRRKVQTKNGERVR